MTRFLKYVMLIMFAVQVANISYAQKSGELTRFGNESLEVKTQVKLYPNPSVDYLSVKIEGVKLKNFHFTVHNIIGNIVEAEIEKVGDGEYKLKVKDLPSGYYLLAIKNDEAHFKKTYKFLKQ